MPGATACAGQPAAEGTAGSTTHRGVPATRLAAVRGRQPDPRGRLAAVSRCIAGKLPGTVATGCDRRTGSVEPGQPRSATRLGGGTGQRPVFAGAGSVGAVSRCGPANGLEPLAVEHAQPATQARRQPQPMPGLRFTGHGRGDSQSWQAQRLALSGLFLVCLRMACGAGQMRVLRTEQGPGVPQP
ncbi:hypothetical protein D3C80_1437160 [compost metagenome]